MGFIKNTVNGWKRALKKGFWGTVKETMEEAYEPIPAELRKYYSYWSSREFSPEVNEQLARISDIVGPKVASYIVNKAKEYMSMANEDIVNDVMSRIPGNLKNAKTSEEAVKELLVMLKGTIKF